MISARNISLVRSGRKILDDVSLEVRAGEIVTIIGPNGAGKTSLLKILLKLDRPDQGLVCQKPGLKIGYVPQKFSVDRSFPLSVRHFIQLGRQGERIPADILEETGVNNLLGKPLSDLSGGEFQRVCLTRALVRRPDLLVLDEPVQGIDYAGEIEIYRLIASVRQQRGCGILLISHDLHVVMGESDRVICLDKHICCSGTPDLVVANPEYERLFGADAVNVRGLYKHRHDHLHGPDGEIIPAGEEGCDSSHHD